MMKNTVQVNFLTFKITKIICVIHGAIQTGLKCYLSLTIKVKLSPKTN